MAFLVPDGFGQNPDFATFSATLAGQIRAWFTADQDLDSAKMGWAGVLSQYADVLQSRLFVYDGDDKRYYLYPSWQDDLQTRLRNCLTRLELLGEQGGPFLLYRQPAGGQTLLTPHSATELRVVALSLAAIQRDADALLGERTAQVLAATNIDDALAVVW